MQKLMVSLAICGLCVMQPLPGHTRDEAKPSRASLVLKKTGRVVKKTILLPVYIAGGVVAGGVAWFYLAGDESSMVDLINTAKGLRQ